MTLYVIVRLKSIILQGVVLFVSLALFSSTELPVLAVDRSDTACPAFLLIFRGRNRILIESQLPYVHDLFLVELLLAQNTFHIACSSFFTREILAPKFAAKLSLEQLTLRSLLTSTGVSHECSDWLTDLVEGGTSNG